MFDGLLANLFYSLRMYGQAERFGERAISSSRQRIDGLGAAVADYQEQMRLIAQQNPQDFASEELYASARLMVAINEDRIQREYARMAEKNARMSQIRARKSKEKRSALSS